MDQQIDLSLTPGSRLASLYGTTSARERTTCNYGLDPAMQHLANAHGLRIAATDATGEVRAIERAEHPFFMGTLYQPQLSSEPGKPHPVFVGLLEALR
jgi:CTP synthase (UTP-ammonia lyase)